MNQPATDNPSTKRISYMEAIIEAQLEELSRDESVVLIGEDLAVYGDGKVMESFGESRIWCAPISENSFCGLAVGAAMTGLRPIVALNIASFMYLSSDQIINQAGKLHFMTGGQMTVPAVFRCTTFHKSYIAAQHSDRPYPMFMNAPGLKIIAPTTPADMKGLLKSAIRDNDPVMVFEDKNLWTVKGDVTTDPEHLVPIGKADIKREGSDITVIAISGAQTQALAAAKTLEKEGVSVEVIDPRTLVPLDIPTLVQSVAKTGKVVLVDNANRSCSIASEIAAIIAEQAFDHLKAPVVRVCTPDIHPGASPSLENALYPDTSDVIAAIQTLHQRQ